MKNSMGMFTFLFYKSFVSFVEKTRLAFRDITKELLQFIAGKLW